MVPVIFPLPASQVPQTDADQGTVTLAILNVGWLQATLRKHIKPSFLVVNCFGASLLKIIFLFFLCVSEIKVAGLKQNQTFFPVAYEANAAKRRPGSCIFVLLLI